MKSCCVAIVLAVGVLVSSTAGAQVPGYLSSWGSYGTANGQFRTPVAVAVGPDGKVYVADSNLNCVKVFTGEGVYLSQWHVQSPVGIAVDSQENVYVVVAVQYSYIAKYTTSGTLVTQWSALANGVAVDGSGNVYATVVVDPYGAYQEHVDKFSPTGALLGEWGSRGTGSGQFDHAEGVAVDALGNVYVADTVNRRVQKFSNAGTYLAQWGGLGSGDGQFQLPVRVATAPGGMVYVVDNPGNRIEEFGDAGSYVGQWGGSGSGLGLFLNPIGIAVDGQGRVFVADTNNSRIQVFGWNATAARLTSWGSLKALYR